MQRILIANRGEIAVRIIRACAESERTSIAIYADQDHDALHVRLADEAYALGGATPATSYLSAEAIVALALRVNADAVHPGYGFLAENADFARAVEAAGLIWIGPRPDTIEQLGNKVAARELATSIGAPLVPGTTEPLANAEEAIAFAEEHGLPVAIKAAFGGGGRGLRVAHSLDEVADSFAAATSEAIAAFGRGECFVERFLEQPRHVEAQIIGDGEGAVVVVGDRDCSLQRRNQKLVEESPAPDLSEEQRASIHDAARRIGEAVNYRGAGTVEFLVGRDGTVSFLEVNTRLQVEHPVTEITAGVDLVAEQFRIAEGRGLSLSETPVPTGHALEFRINAEDPGRGFLPAAGQVTGLRVPGGPGIRWDAGVEAGDRVEAAFDSMLAKLIVFAPDRAQALARGRRALRELEVSGVATAVPFHRAVLEEPAFTDAPFGVYTQWIEQELLPKLPTAPRSAAAAASEIVRFAVELDGRLVMLGLPAEMLARLGTNASSDAAHAAAGKTPEADPTLLEAPVAGTLVRRLVDEGASVTTGTPVAVLEAMKMETQVVAHRDGVVQWRVDEGETVALDAPIAVIAAE